MIQLECDDNERDLENDTHEIEKDNNIAHKQTIKRH